MTETNTLRFLNIVTGDLSIFREDVSQKWINRYLECQAYLPFAGEKEFERAEAIRGYIEKRNGECTEVARKIPLIPPV